MAGDDAFIDRFGPVFLDSYFVVDRERRITSFNPALLQLLDLRPTQRRELTGKPCYELLNLEICRDQCIALQALARDGHVRVEEILGKTHDGRDLVLELSAIPLHDANKKVTGVFVTHRDVTDERRLKTRQVEEKEEHLKEREALLKIIRDRDEELTDLRNKVGRNR
ncbi:MAG: PAS domain-containing protein [Myxococcota bacterium]